MIWCSDQHLIRQEVKSWVTHSVAVSAAAGAASARGGSKVGTAAADLAGVEVGDTLLVGDP